MRRKGAEGDVNDSECVKRSRAGEEKLEECPAIVAFLQGDGAGRSESDDS